VQKCCWLVFGAEKMCEEKFGKIFGGENLCVEKIQMGIL
jgi:hypothetical protein